MEQSFLREEQRSRAPGALRQCQAGAPSWKQPLSQPQRGVGVINATSKCGKGQEAL